MRKVALQIVVLALASAGCDGSAGTAPRGTPPKLTPSPPASEAGVVTTLRLQPVGDGAVVGGSIVVDVLGFDASGAPASTGEAQVFLSDTKVGSVESDDAIRITDTGTGKTFTRQRVSIAFWAAGTTALRVSLGSATASLAWQVVEAPPSTALAVESFEVFESPEACAWACPYLVYWPVLKLRETTLTSAATVVSVEFTIPGKATGNCRGGVYFMPGVTAYLNEFDPYLWSNELIFVNLDGTPVPEGDATVRLTVLDGAGRFGSVRAKTRITRMANDPPLPMRPSPGAEVWSCR